jgi:signal transduction histidine kinase
MESRIQHVQNLLWKEVASKSPSASIAFVLIAVFVALYQFGIKGQGTKLEVLCAVIILSNFVRIWIAQKIGQETVVSPKNRLILQVSIWINTGAWSAIFALSAWHLESDGQDYIVLITVLIGFLATSIVTLGYHKSIFIPFQFALILPVVLIAAYQSYTGQSSHSHLLVINYTIFLLYQVRQYRDYRKQILIRFNNQIDLENSYRELKRSKDELIKKTTDLVQASRIQALGEMAGGLAHEVNNSLMIIIGSIQQIDRQLGTPPESLKHKITQSTNAIMKIKTVIEGLKFFSREMETGPKVETELWSIIQSTMTYTHELLKAHGIELIIEEVPKVNLLCRPFQITQILFNLTKNADDALKDHAKPGRIIFSFEVRSDYLFIRVTNNGLRMTEETSSRLFQPFFTTKDVGQGTGLSLSIAKGIALEHRGDLYYDPNEAETTFVLKLPIEK